jgi:hypothetical protein
MALVKKDGMLNTAVAMRLQMSGVLHLVVGSGDQTGTEFVVAGEQMIGNAASADIFLDDPLVSPCHARLVKERNWWKIIDQLSENGTFVNGRFTRESPLFPDCEILMGNTRLTVKYSEPPDIETAIVRRSGQWVQLPRIIAHELKNYLQFFDAGIEQLKQNAEFIEKYEGEIRSLEMAGEKMDELVQMLRAGCIDPVFSPVDVTETLWEQVSLIEGAARSAGVELNIDIPDQKIMIYADPNQIGRAILNILKNSMEACSRAQSIHVSIPEITGTTIRIIIRDTGQGMDSQTLESFWEPLFTTRARGNGLGAFIARTTILKHNGSIHAESTTGKGTKITIELPRYQNP